MIEKYDNYDGRDHYWCHVFSLFFDPENRSMVLLEDAEADGREKINKRQLGELIDQLQRIHEQMTD
jgi:hypothetical protein